MSLAIDHDAYFAEHRRAFGPLNQSQVDGVRVLLEGMAADPPLTDVRHAAYMLATAWWETAQTMQPIAERGRKTYFNRYDPVLAKTPKHRARARAMGNTQEGDGYRYRGRGYVQLTWRNNYRRAAEVVGVDLVADPDRAMDPAIAYQIMTHGMRHGWFTGVKLADVLGGSRYDYVQARRVINGLDEAQRIAGVARQFETILRAALIEKKAESPAP